MEMETDGEGEEPPGERFLLTPATMITSLRLG